MLEVALLVPLVGAVRDVFLGLVMVLFVLSTLLLMLVILIQEGKGGGITGVFGGGFTETFGVKAGTVNRFTAYLAASFLVLALLYAGLSAKSESPKLRTLPTVPVSTPEGGPTPPSATDPTPPTQPGGSTPPGEQPPGETPDQPPQGPPTPPVPPSPPEGGSPPPGGTGGGEQPR